MTDAILDEMPYTTAELEALVARNGLSDGITVIPRKSEGVIDSRAVKQAWGTWIAEQGPWHMFGALTYDQERTSVRLGQAERPPAADTVLRDARRWLGRVSRDTQGGLEAAVVALEYHKSGWPHLHPLLRFAGAQGDTTYATVGRPWYQANGYARLEKPRDQVDVAAYASKYLVKELDHGTVTFWPQRGPWPPHQAPLEDTSLSGRPVPQARHTLR